jgi:hypothetical protein
MCAAAVNALKIIVHTDASILTFEAIPERTLRAMIGKHGELRIMQIQTHEDVDIETKQQMETVKYLRTFNRLYWADYENGD